MSHPVKLLLSDDLERTRVTVCFRLILAIPLLVWLWLWAIAMLVVLTLNWVATLATGTPWAAGHRFSSRFVRFTVHTYAYVGLLAEPYPGFRGERGYPVDVELPEPARQSRWTVAFRWLLAVPALVLASLLTWGYWEVQRHQSAGRFGIGLGLLSAVALLGWFAALASKRMPRGLRDAGAYGLLYAAQTLAYLLLVTDRYPNSDPQAALPDLPVREDAIRLEVEEDGRRSRVTTFFRLLLAFVHFVWAAIWGIAVLAAVVVSWFVQVVAGRPHAGIHRFVSTYLRYVTHVYAYGYLLADPFPEFDGREGGYPVELVVAGPQRQRRLTVAFRFFLALPAFVVASAYSSVALAAAVFGWFAILATGRMPRGLRNAIALWLRYNQQTSAYAFLLTEQYPYSGPTASGRQAEPDQPAFLPPDALATT
jgi:Domain of unknown function (DUF4389)